LRGFARERAPDLIAAIDVIVAVSPLRHMSRLADGMFTGNRGIIHDPLSRTLLNRRWASQAWLICTLQWRGIRRTVMGTRSWTELVRCREARLKCHGCRASAGGAALGCFVQPLLASGIFIFIVGYYAWTSQGIHASR
jgi:hypothetical protein